MELRSRAVRVAVDEHADDARQGPLDGELARTQQRYIAEPDAACGGGRELGSEVVGRGEDHADQIVVIEAVPGEQLRDERVRPRLDLGLRVLVTRDRTTERAQLHEAGGY